MQPFEVLWTAVVGFVIVGAIGFVLSIYNGVVELRNQVGRAWANLDATLRQRLADVPVLLEVCGARLELERGACAELVAACAHAGEARSMVERAQAERAVGEAIGRVFIEAVQEPALALTPEFREIQRRFGETEQQLTDRRRYHEDLVILFNTRIAATPDVVFARMMRLAPAESFRTPGTVREAAPLELQHSA